MERLQKILSQAGIARVYEARVLGEPDAHDLSRLSKGIAIEGRRTESAEVVELGSGHLRITVREGRNRQVRKMCEAIGHPVDELRRVAIGPIRDAKLKLGSWRDLRDDEVAVLRKAASRAEPGPEASRRQARGRRRST